jgi:hypothetical protein
VSKSHKDQRSHRRKVAGTGRGLAEHRKRDVRRGRVYPAPGSDIPPENNGGQAGYVVGECGHRVAKSEWRAGFRVCERCGA